MSLDLDTITHVCICGSEFWQPEWIAFSDYEISAYSLSMKCVHCGAKAIAPTEVDRP